MSGFDIVRDLPRHIGPCRQPVRALELDALALQIGSHPIERLDQPREFVGRRVARMRASRSPRAIRPVAFIRRLTGSAMRSAIQYDHRAEQDEQHRAAARRSSSSICTSISCCRKGGRHGQHRIAVLDSDGRRRHQILGEPIVSRPTYEGRPSRMMAR